MRTTRQQLRKRNAGAAAAVHGVASARVAETTRVLEGQVTAVDDDGAVRGRLDGDTPVSARCPQHIDKAWLRAAVAVAPVDCLFVLPQGSRRAVLWGVFPGAEHEAVRADVELRGRRVTVNAESIHLGCGKATMTLDKAGSVEVRGRDVLSRASRVNRVKGGAVRIN